MVAFNWNVPTHQIPANKYMLQVSNRNTKKRCEIYAKLTIKTPEPRTASMERFAKIVNSWKQLTIFATNSLMRSPCVCSVNLVLANYSPFSSVEFVEFEQVDVCWNINYIYYKYPPKQKKIRRKTQKPGQKTEKQGNKLP